MYSEEEINYDKSIRLSDNRNELFWTYILGRLDNVFYPIFIRLDGIYKQIDGLSFIEFHMNDMGFNESNNLDFEDFNQFILWLKGFYMRNRTLPKEIPQRKLLLRILRKPEVNKFTKINFID